MKDAVFSGADVGAALEAAGRALGLRPADLRYVVLDPGSPPGLGIAATPARIAVLLERPAPPRPLLPREEDEETRPLAEDEDPEDLLRETLEALAGAAGLELAVEVSEDRDELRARLTGPGAAFFLDEGGEPLRALDHLLHRMLDHRLEPRRLRLECEGYREARDEALRLRALRMAEDVRASGRHRETEPLNAYERRVIHVALTGAPGVRTYSVGEGAERRVRVAPQGGTEGDPGAALEPPREG
jgi:spoIIIJ-associated protein